MRDQDTPPDGEPQPEPEKKIEIVEGLAQGGDAYDPGRFLKALDPHAEGFTLSTFDDNNQRDDKSLARNFHGTLAQHEPELRRRNNLGAGVFICVNRTDFKGRSSGNVVGVRAVFVDLDGAPLDPVLAAKMKPHIVIESSPGHYHCYWLVNGLALEQFTPVQNALAKKFNGDPKVNDLPRLLRLPGFDHRKGEPFRSRILQINDWPVYTAKNFWPVPKEEQQEDEHKQEQKPPKQRDEAIRSLDINSAALVQQDKWVKKLFPHAVPDNKGGHRVKSKRLGRNLEEDIGISVKGVVDFGLRDQPGETREGKRFATDLVREYRGLSTFKEAAAWLRQAGVEDDPLLTEMNQEFAAGSVKGKFRVIKWMPDTNYPYQRVAEFYTQPDFQNFVVNPKVQIPKFDKKGKRAGVVSVPRGGWWLAQEERREFDGIDFRPGAKGEFEVRRGDKAYRMLNMYSGFAVEPDYDNSEEKCLLYLEHIRDNIAGGDPIQYEYALDWMASGVQHPENPGRTALSLRGEPGVGKGVFATEYGKLFGRHFLHALNRDHITGRFNAHTAEVCLVYVDEALYAELRSDAQILKGLVSEKTKLLERKGIDVVQIKNYARYIFASNAEHPLQIDAGDRRYNPLFACNNALWADRQEGWQEKRTAYFRAIINQMENGGRAALLGFLLKRDISKFNPEVIAETAERNKQKIMSAEDGDKVIIGFAEDGCLPGVYDDNRPNRARVNDDDNHKGCLYPAMRQRGGYRLRQASDKFLSGVLQRWEFSWHSTGKFTVYDAPSLPDLRRLIDERYGPQEWDKRTDWGQELPAKATEGRPKEPPINGMADEIPF